MNNFNRGGKRGGRTSMGEKPQMHQVTCNDCGVRCQVPFKPTGERPVYCSECFENHSEGGRFKKQTTSRTSRKEESNCCQGTTQEQLKHYNNFSDKMDEVIGRLDKIIGFLSESKRDLDLKSALKTAKKEVKKEAKKEVKKEVKKKPKKVVEKKPKKK